MKKQSGFTFVETLVAVGVLGLIVSSAATMASLLSHQVQRSILESEREKVLFAIISEIRSQSNLQLPNYGSTPNSTLLQTNNLPLAWSDKYFGPVAGCPTCPGRAGYVLRPLPNLDGTYIATIQIVNNFSGVEYAPYQFVVVAK